MTSQSQRLLMTGIPTTLAIWPRGQARSEALIEIRCSEPDGSPSQGATAQLDATQGLLTRHGDDAWGSKASAITDSEGAALFDYTAHWNSGTAPGTSEIEAIVHYQDRAIERSVMPITLVGMPASIAMTATPSLLSCGEMSLVVVTVTDALNQSAVDETPIRLYTNHGGVLAPPRVRTHDGVAVTHLLTSEAHSGAYEVVAVATDNPPGTPALSSVVTVMAQRHSVERTSIEEIVDSLNRERAGQPAAAGNGPGPQRRSRAVKAILFSDIEPSIASSSEVGDQAWSAIRDEHDAIVRNAVEMHRGLVVRNQGDGFMCSFDLPADALHCAIEIQRDLEGYRAAHQDGLRRSLRLRIGAHIGEVEMEGGDLFGSEVNLAARLAVEAQGSEILISDAMHQLLAGRPEIRSGGTREFTPKGESRAITVHEVVWQQQG